MTTSVSKYTGSYDYIAQAYGVSPVAGGRVRHHVTKKEGTIMRARPPFHYVHVKFDGDVFSLPCHPTEIDYLDGK